MPQDDTSALNTKMDFLVDELRNLRDDMKSDMKSVREEMSHMKSEFDQSRGAVRLIKFAVWTAGIVATLWAVFHTGVR